MRRPWMGNQFEAGGFLILGESHYWDEAGAEDPELTNDVVSSVVDGKRIGFFTSVERAVTGCGPGETQPSTFWHGVAFANFCPGAACPSDKRPTPDMWTRGVEEFPRLLSRVRPGRVLFVTKGVWDRTEQTDEAEIEWEHGDPILVDGRKHPTGFFATKDGQHEHTPRTSTIHRPMDGAPISGAGSSGSSCPVMPLPADRRQSDLTVEALVQASPRDIAEDHPLMLQTQDMFAEGRWAFRCGQTPALF